MSLAVPAKGIVCFLFLPLITYAQPEVFEANIREAVHSKPKFTIKLDNRNSFVTNTFVRTFGIKAAVSYRKIIEFGIGYNFLISNYKKTIDNLEQTLYYNYLSPYVQYNFLVKKKFEIQLPVQFGAGYSYFEYLGKVSHKAFVVSYEPAITFIYKPVKFIGVGIGTGYRLMLVSNTKIDEQFTSPIYLYKMIFYFNELIKKKD